jgi:hypothetical protein
MKNLTKAEEIAVLLACPDKQFLSLFVRQRGRGQTLFAMTKHKKHVLGELRTT